jgi:hypothetical protein
LISRLVYSVAELRVSLWRIEAWLIGVFGG